MIELSQGVVGQPCLQATGTASGKRDAAWAEGWLCTGDVAWCDDDGFYYLVDYLVDHVNDMYKSGGENVAPAEVERVLATHPNVLDVAVTRILDAMKGRGLRSS